MNLAKKRDKQRWSVSGPSRAEQLEQKRDALIREAGRAFARKGFHNTSLDEIAQTLNVTKPALYYYFSSKQDILFACHNQTMEIARRAREIAFSTSDESFERFKLFLRNYIILLTSEFGSPAVLMEPISSLSEEQRSVILGRRREFETMLRELVADSIKQGFIRPCSPKLASAFFMGAITSIPRWFNREGPISGEELADAYIEFVLNGLATTGA